MEIGAVVERVRRVAEVRADGAARRPEVEDALANVRRVRARLDAARTWVDADGMWNLRGRFDPVSCLRIASRRGGYRPTSRERPT